jgi:peptidoglycan-associated lipoprotein
MKRFLCVTLLIVGLLLFGAVVGLSLVSNADAASRALKVWEYPLDSGCLNTMLMDDSRWVRVTADQEYDDIVPCPPCTPKPVVVVEAPKPEPTPAPIVVEKKEPVVFTVHFDFDKSNIKASEQMIIDDAAEYILNDSDAKVIIAEGHCDVRGSDDYNIALGMRRAVSVKNALVAKGIDPAVIEVVSKGEFEAIFDLHWENRRVHIIIE